MRVVILILLFITCFMGYFFILSCIGLLWVPSYHEIISNGFWFMLYTLAIGWWTAAGSCMEYWDKYIENPKKD